MKYYTIVFPGEFGQHVQETWNTKQILKSYYTYWVTKMIENSKEADISEHICIEDWCITHWAMETDEFGNKLWEKRNEST
jgi:hypothetical protein